MAGVPGRLEQVAVVSCDLVGHSTTDGEEQVRRVTAINDIVHTAIRRSRPGGIVWSSGGDGGHVVFRGDAWQADALLLILELSGWAEDENAKLRITGHVGPVVDITGADGRIQVVGEGINFAGWLLRQLHSGTRAVSDSFRRAMAPPPKGVELRFHDERLFFDRKSEPQLLYLMSLGRFESSWIDSWDSDHTLMKRALADPGEKGWNVLYHAKRILQADVKDAEVAAALRTIAPRLKAEDPEQHNLLGLMDHKELAEVLKLGQLVERRPGEAICRYGDPGGSMFVILHGDVGVYNLEGKGYGGIASPKHVHQAGQVVGELGPVLRRSRTADLVALTDVGLLSFDSEEVLVKLSTTAEGRKAARQFEQFITARLLEHTCQGASYLVGLNRTGPLTIGPDGMRPRAGKDDSIWKETLRELRPHIRSITVEQGPLTLEFDHLAERGDGGYGLYVLVSGRLRSTEEPTIDLHGAQFPVLWVDLPGVLRRPLRSYVREQEPIMIIRIDAEGIRAMPIQQRKALRDSLEGVVGEVPEEYEYQVYLCHATLDKMLVGQIHRRLEESGIKTWYDEVQLSEGGSVLRRMENGLRSSRYLLVCASANFMVASWGMREYESVMNLEVTRRGGKVLVLRLYENESDDMSVPLLVSGNKQWRFWVEEEFDSLVRMLDDRGRGERT